MSRELDTLESIINGYDGDIKEEMIQYFEELVRKARKFDVCIRYSVEDYEWFDEGCYDLIGHIVEDTSRDELDPYIYTFNRGDQ